MTVNKLTLPSKINDVQSKINEIIDNLGGTTPTITVISDSNGNVILTTTGINVYDDNNGNIILS